MGAIGVVLFLVLIIIVLFYLLFKAGREFLKYIKTIKLDKEILKRKSNEIIKELVTLIKAFFENLKIGAGAILLIIIIRFTLKSENIIENNYSFQGIEMGMTPQEIGLKNVCKSFQETNANKHMYSCILNGNIFSLKNDLEFALRFENDRLKYMWAILNLRDMEKVVNFIAIEIGAPTSFKVNSEVNPKNSKDLSAIWDKQKIKIHAYGIGLAVIEIGG